MGIDLLIIIDATIREFSLKNRWSIYIRGLIGIALFEIGAGVIYGFENLKNIYAITLINVLISTFLFQHL